MIKTLFSPETKMFTNINETQQYILIVEDEPRVRSSTRAILEKDYWNILECGSGGEAIEILKSRSVDLVLLDINLPDISGLEIMQWIADNNITASVVVVSGDTNIDSAIFALRRGATEYIKKPYDPEELMLKIEDILIRRVIDKNNFLMTSHLEHSEQLHRFLVETSPDLIFTLDRLGCFTFVNGRVESLLGYSQKQLIGASYTTLVHEDDMEKARFAFIERRQDNRATTNVDIRLQRNNRRQNFDSPNIIMMISSIGIYDNDSSSGELHTDCFKGTYGVARDVTKRKIAEETIVFQAFHDQLTQLPNKRLFKDRMEIAITHSKRYGNMFGVMFIDLNDFKIVNDTLGHMAGDHILQRVARRLRQCIRTVDTLARQGGDEFTLLLPDLTKPEDASIIAQKILKELDQPFSLNGHTFQISASIGIAIFPRDGDTIDTLLKNADAAMYRVKSSGGHNSGYVFFTPDR